MAKIKDFALRKKGREKTWMAKVVLFSSGNMGTKKCEKKSEFLISKCLNVNIEVAST